MIATFMQEKVRPKLLKNFLEDQICNYLFPENQRSNLVWPGSPSCIPTLIHRFRYLCKGIIKMGNSIIRDTRAPRAVGVSVTSHHQDPDLVKDHLRELSFLAGTAGIRTVRSFTQKLKVPDRNTYVGKGKLTEIREFIQEEDIQTAIFDDELTPSQLRNVEKALDCKIYDRSLLILDIFLLRAKTSQARTQVELARNEYLLPRLTRMWTHLERQRGGTATRGGAGEKEIETDRRRIRNKIALQKAKLKKIDKQAAIQRKSRSRVVKVILVGYTNSGKSTLMKTLSKTDVFAENKLFATVDSTVRKVVISNIPFLLTDTVGVIRKLPHSLIESFKSTLDEVREADILMHVVDVSHPHYEDQIKVVNDTLRELEALDKPTVLVLNKVDLLRARIGMENGKALLNLNGQTDSVRPILVSALNNEKINELRELVAGIVKKKHITIYPNYLPEVTSG